MNVCERRSRGSASGSLGAGQAPWMSEGGAAALSSPLTAVAVEDAPLDASGLAALRTDSKNENKHRRAVAGLVSRLRRADPDPDRHPIP